MSRFRPLLLLSLLLPVLASAQKVVAWGNNFNGQLNIPAGLVPGTVVPGYDHGLGIRPDGTVAAWGYNEYGQTNVPAGLTGVAQVWGGASHSLARRSNGTWAGWGRNDFGQCDVPAGLVATQVSAGGYHNLARKADGTVVAWGRDLYGERTVPAGLAGVVQVAAGNSHSLALKSDGTVVAWGRNTSGQTDVPAGLSEVAQVAAGGGHSLALRSDGLVVGWGGNTKGETTIPNGLLATQVQAANQFSVALKPNGTVVAWGDNAKGQCNVPADLTGVLRISAGWLHVYALVAAVHAVVDQPVIYAGAVATGTVKLAGPAPAGGIVVPLTCDAPNVHIPSSVTIPAGETERTFPVTSDVAYTTRTATISTSYLGTETVPFKLVVLRDSAQITLTKGTVYGGSTTNVTATLGVSFTTPEDTIFDLTCDNPAVQVPATVRLRGRNITANFFVTHSLVATEQTAIISASTGGILVARTSLTVKPIGGVLSLSPADLFGGETGQGTVTLSAPVAQPLTVSLASSRPVASVPASVTVPAGSKTATFSIATERVTKPISSVISSTANGRTSSVVLRLLPRSNLQSVTLPTYLFGHQRVTGTVRLATPAPAGGQTVSLTSSDPNLVLPASVTIPAGATSATFTAEGADVESTADVTVAALFNGDSVGTEIEVRALTISSLSLSAATASAGGTVTGTVMLNVPVDIATTVALTSDNPAVAGVPATVTIPAGSRTATFSIGVNPPGATAKNVRITAAKNGTSAYRTLKVNP